jgi:hypothetical protein
MKHYRINKVDRPGGRVLKKRDILVASDKDALTVAGQDEDCPVCDVVKAGERIESIV